MSKEIDEFALKRVPRNGRLPFIGVALVHAGMLTALDQFMLGAALGHGMSIFDAYTAILIASIICGVLTYGMGVAGMQEGMSCSLLARWYGFGRIGSALIGLVIAISLMGWFGIQTAIFGKSLDFAFGGHLGFKVSAAIAGILLTILVSIGFKALRWIAKFAIPLFLAAICYLSFITLSGQDIPALIQAQPSGEVISISSAITIIIGSYILAALITPDITRYLSSKKQVLGVSLITIIVGEFIVNGLAITLARCINSADVVTIMSTAAGGVGLLIVIFSTLRVNDLNLYSSSLGLVNAVECLFGIKLHYAITTLCIGAVGTTLSIMGILDRFIDFLELLGILFPPIVGIMLVEFYFVRAYKNVLDNSRITETLPDQENTPNIVWPGILGCVFGTIIGFVITVGVPAINSLVAASLFYYVVTVLLYRYKLMNRPLQLD